MEILQNTHEYSDAFHSKELEKIYDLLDKDAEWVTTGRTIQGREEIADFLKSLFKEKLSYFAEKVLVQESFSLIEFSLTLGKSKFRGTDHFTWNSSEKIESIHTYITI